MKNFLFIFALILSSTLYADETKYGRLKVVSTTKASHPCPSMSDAQMLAIASPEEGDCVDNTTLQNWMRYNASIPGWEELAGGGSGGGIEDWATAQVYNTGDVVIESLKIYQALSDHSSGTFAADLTDGKWQALKNEAVNIENTPSGNLEAADVQGALDELQGDIDTNTADIATNTSAIADLDSTYATDTDVTDALALKQDAATAATDTELSDGLALKQDAATAATDAELALKADIASPTLTGDPKVPTPSNGDNDTSIASTAFVQDAISGFSTTADLSTATGILAMSKGGSSKNLTAVAGGVVISDNDSMEVLGAGTSGQVLNSNGTSMASWSNRYIAAKSINGASLSLEEFRTMPGKLTQVDTNKYLLEGTDKNLFTNPGFEHSTPTTGWTITSTGTATCTTATTTTSGIEGENQFLVLTASGGASGGTCSIKQSANANTGMQALMGAWFLPEAIGSSGSGITTVVYTLVNGSRITSRDISATGTSTSWQSFFVSEVANTSIGVEALITVPASTSIDLGIEGAKAQVGDATQTASIITPWQSCGLTTSDFVGFGTVSSISFDCKQDGTDLLIRGKATVGTPTGVEARINLKMGGRSFTVSGSIASSSIVGRGSRSNLTTLGSGKHYSVIVDPGEAYLQIGWSEQDLAYATGTPRNGDALVTSGNVVEISEARIPVNELSGSTQVFASQCGARCIDRHVAEMDIATGAITGENVDFINGNAGGTSSTRTISFNSGIYTVKPLCELELITNATTNAGKINGTLSVSTTGITNIIAFRTTDGASVTNGTVKITCDKTGADYTATRTIVGSFKVPEDEVWLTGGNGYGSTNTKIKRFVTTLKNTGSAISYSDSATLGSSFTINTSGNYAITYCDGATAQGNFIGLSLNSSQLTTNIQSITNADRLASKAAYVGNISYTYCVESHGYFPQGSVIRPHGEGNATGVTDFVTNFRIKKVSL
jgi:hypothetical protein